MAILYVFSINDPNNSGALPPSAMTSTWFQNLTNYWSKHAISGGYGFSTVAVVFQSQSELQSYIDTYKCTDSSLLADIDAWKTAHSVTYNSYYYTLTDAGISPTPTPIIS